MVFKVFVFAQPILAPARIETNIRDKRSFSGTKWKKNLGKSRAE